MAEPLRPPPFLLVRQLLQTKVIRTATASRRPSIGLGRARGESLRASSRPTGRCKVPTNGVPRHSPACQELRSNQRLYVSLGSPPLVAVGLCSARAAHQSR